MVHDTLKLGNKVALITGGSSGIGLASAQLMHEHGASIVIVGRNQQKLDAAVSVIGERAVGVVADVSRVAEIDRIVATVKASHGRIDILLANAGMSHSPPLNEVDEAAFDTMIGINLKGVFFTCARGLPLLSTDASIIVTGSAAASMGRLGDPLYAATKAAVRSLARTLANLDEVKSKGIRVNILAPGADKTPLTKSAYELPEVDADVRDAIPLQRWGEPSEIARGALFLACNDSSYVTGSVLAVDGGMAQI